MKRKSPRRAPPPSAGLSIDVIWRLRESWRAAALLKRVALHALEAEGFTEGSLSVAVVGSRAMRSVHRRFMGIDEPTDVLTFEFDSDRRRHRVDGEIIVCADVALRSVGNVRRRARAELALYVVHGVLHLAGYDDRWPADFARMHAREDCLLMGLGLGPVFKSP